MGCGIKKKKKISKYNGSFVKNSKFMYLNARIPTAFLPSLSTYHICKKPNGFLSFSLSLQIPEQRSLSLLIFFSLSLSPKPPTHSSPLSQSPPFLLGSSIILFASPSLHPTALISLLSFFFSSVQVTYHRFLAFVIRFEKLNFSGFVVFD